MKRVFDPVHIGTIEIFCKAAETGSFTATAEFLGVTPASVSRAISRLETRLGVRLFNRTTRSVRLTHEGEFYKTQCQQALDQMAQAERVITGQRQVPKGTLRISVGTVYAHHRLIPWLPDFMQTYPDIEVVLNVSNRNIDLVDDGYDLAIRLGTPPDSRLVARKLEDASLGVFAAPAYLQRHGTPTSLEDLERHELIQFIMPSTGRPMPWALCSPSGQALDFAFKSRRLVHEDVLAGVRWAVAGGGLFQIYDFVAQQALASGQLVEVLSAFRGRSRPFYALYPQNRHLWERVRVFVDYLVQRCP